MKRRANLVIFGSALGLAAIAAAIDHTKHRLPEPQAASSAQPGQPADADGAVALGGDSPCGLDDAPCGLGGNPCGLGASPCSLE